jgi:mRNA interferase MazF
VRGEIYRLRAPRDVRGHEQSGLRYAVVVQSNQLPLSTWLVAPTSTMAAVDPTRLGRVAGHLSFDELRHVDAALRLVLGL